MCDKMPAMRAIPWDFKDKNKLQQIWHWLKTPRRYELTEDWKYIIPTGEKLIIRSGFDFDGASIPRPFRPFLSPTGLLLVGGLVHDFGYRYNKYILADGRDFAVRGGKFFVDNLFRIIVYKETGFKILANIVYYAVRIGGNKAWKGYRENDSI